MTKTYLISGGAGFIGSHLIEKLLNDKNQVFCIDNLITGSKKNIEKFLDNPHFKFYSKDITRPITIDSPINCVINLACPASPVDYGKFPLETMQVCANGTKNMLEIARVNKTRFIQASTSEVYGDPQEHPQRESYWGNVNPYGPRSCYDEGKRYAEALIYAYRQKYALNTGVVRIFNTYGPRMRPFDGRVVSTFIRQALLAEDLTIFGHGQQTRSFCYVSDLVRALIKMADSAEEGPINLGNPNELTIKEIAEKIITLTGSKSTLTYKEMPLDDPAQRKPDISQAHHQLDWQQEVSLEEGLSRTIAWFKSLDQQELERA